MRNIIKNGLVQVLVHIMVVLQIKDFGWQMLLRITPPMVLKIKDALCLWIWDLTLDKEKPSMKK